MHRIGWREPLSNTNLRRRILRFAVTGTITAVVYLAMGALLIEWLELRAGLSGAIAFITIIPLNYWLHKFWSFKSLHLHREAVPRFLATLAIGVAINSSVIELVAALYSPHYLIGQLSGMGYVIVWNYVVFDRWVFPNPSRRASPTPPAKLDEAG